MDKWATHMVFPADIAVQTRVDYTAPIINSMIEAFERQEISDGTQTFQDILIQKIRSAKLLDDDVWMSVDHVGVHPDNREGAGLVPIDVHDLLLRCM